jgi:hypothetical protein
MLVSVGLMIYMQISGFINGAVVLGYILLWLIIFLSYGNIRSLGMLFQAPIYAWFILIAMRESPTIGVWLIAWIAAAIVISWPRFPNEIVPGFLGGLRDVSNRSRPPSA